MTFNVGDIVAARTAAGDIDTDRIGKVVCVYEDSFIFPNMKTYRVSYMDERVPSAGRYNSWDVYVTQDLILLSVEMLYHIMSIKKCWDKHPIKNLLR